MSSPRIPRNPDPGVVEVMPPVGFRRLPVERRYPVFEKGEEDDDVSNKSPSKGDLKDFPALLLLLLLGFDLEVAVVVVLIPEAEVEEPEGCMFLSRLRT